MENLLDNALLLIDRWSYILYAVGALGIILYLLRAREAARQRRYTPFPIEREEASAMLRDSLLILVILVAIVGTTFYIDRVLLDPSEAARDDTIAQRDPTPEPTSPVISVRPTLAPTLTLEAGVTDPLTTTGEITETTELTTTESLPTREATQELAPGAATETPTPEAEGEEPSPTPTRTTSPTRTATPGTQPTLPPTATPRSSQPTQTPPPTNTPVPPTATQEPTAIPTQPPLPTQPPPPTSPPPPPVPAANCNTPGVRITSPAHGQTVSGNASIIGTASIDGFQFYKVEFGQGGNPNSFAAIGDIVHQPVVDGFLASWPASSFPSGIWTLRLTVVDQTGNFPAPCDIRVIVP
jgi:hypothetical protein